MLLCGSFFFSGVWSALAASSVWSPQHLLLSSDWCLGTLSKQESLEVWYFFLNPTWALQQEPVATNEAALLKQTYVQFAGQMFMFFIHLFEIHFNKSEVLTDMPICSQRGHINNLDLPQRHHFTFETLAANSPRSQPGHIYSAVYVDPS